VIDAFGGLACPKSRPLRRRTQHAENRSEAVFSEPNSTHVMGHAPKGRSTTRGPLRFGLRSRPSLAPATPAGRQAMAERYCDKGDCTGRRRAPRPETSSNHHRGPRTIHPLDPRTSLRQGRPKVPSRGPPRVPRLAPRTYRPQGRQRGLHRAQRNDPRRDPRTRRPRVLRILRPDQRRDLESNRCRSCLRVSDQARPLQLLIDGCSRGAVLTGTPWQGFTREGDEP